MTTVNQTKLTKTQLLQLQECRDAADGVGWMSEPTLRVLERVGLVARLHPTCSGARLTDAGKEYFAPREYRVRRENGDLDTLVLCSDCRTTIDDFATVLSNKPSSGSCDRYGR